MSLLWEVNVRFRIYASERTEAEVIAQEAAGILHQEGFQHLGVGEIKEIKNERE